MRGLDLKLPIALNLSKALTSEKKHLLTLKRQTSNTSKYIHGKKQDLLHRVAV